jgi:hypothetical protein
MEPVKPVLDETTKEILVQKEQVARLKALADKQPFYKYNGVWTRELQNLVCYTSFIIHTNVTDPETRLLLLNSVLGWAGLRSTRAIALLRS